MAMEPVFSDYPAGVAMPQQRTANVLVAAPTLLLRTPPSPNGVTPRPVSVLAGVGMKIERHPPHTVLKVAHVEFAGSHKPIAVGDAVEFVDGKPVPAGEEGLESVVQGEYGTTVLLELRSRDTGLRYEVLLRRHLKKEALICTLDTPELTPRIIPLSPRKAQRAGRPSSEAAPGAGRPTSEAAPAPSASNGSQQRTSISARTRLAYQVHSIRKLVLTLHQGLPPGQEKQDPVLTPTSIGITITSPTSVWPSSAIKRITGLTQGGPAFLSGSLQEGDLLVAVEEVGLSGLPPSTDVAEVIRANGPIGSHVTLRIQSGQDGQERDVLINRTSLEGMECAEALFHSIASLPPYPASPHLSATFAKEYESAIQKVLTAAMQVERVRQLTECKQASALLDIQSIFLSELNRLEGFLDQLAGNEDPPPELGIIWPKKMELLSVSESCSTCQRLNEQLRAQELALQEHRKQLHREAALHRQEIDREAALHRQEIASLNQQLQESAGVLDACKQACAVLGSEAEDLKRAHAELQLGLGQRSREEEEERIIIAHELSSLRTKVAEMYKELQQCDAQREAAEEANRQLQTKVKSLEGQVLECEMCFEQELSQLKVSLRSAQNSLCHTKASGDSVASNADLKRRLLDLKSERDHLSETVHLQALLLEDLRERLEQGGEEERYMLHDIGERSARDPGTSSLGVR